MSKIRFTEPNREILARRDSIINDLTRLVDPAGLITSTDECRAYETDALTAYRKMPLAVVLPSTTAEISAVMAYCHATQCASPPSTVADGFFNTITSRLRAK